MADSFLRSLRGQRAYQDAATYNQHLAQHQAYTAQAQAASQQSSAYRNPYVASQAQQQQVPAAVGSLRQDYAVTQNLQPASSSVPALAQQSSTVCSNPTSIDIANCLVVYVQLQHSIFLPIWHRTLPRTRTIRTPEHGQIPLTIILSILTPSSGSCSSAAHES